MPTNAREFRAVLLDWTEIHELPGGGWPPERLLSLLESLEVDGVSEDDALEMSLLALQDLEPDEAGERLLQAEFGEQMRPGVRQNVAQDLGEERPWEDHADITQQVGIFNTVVLLQKALPREFDKPDIVSAVIRIETQSAQARTWLDAPEPDRALLLRILAGPMDDRAILRRLFLPSLQGSQFPEADSILWKVSRRPAVDGGYEFELISSHQWFDALKELDGSEGWSAQAWPDASESDED